MLATKKKRTHLWVPLFHAARTVGIEVMEYSSGRCIVRCDFVCKERGGME